MKTPPFMLRSLARALTCAVLLAAAASTGALADGPTQPDPPVPEGVPPAPAVAAPMIVAQASPERFAQVSPASIAQASADPSQAPAVSAAPAATASAAQEEPDCHCAALYARDLESRVEGHVERWESLPRAAVQQERAAREERTVARRAFVPLKVAYFVDGVVGFPLHDFRLADDPEEL